MTLFPLGPVTSQWDYLSICLGGLWCICQEVIAPLRFHAALALTLLRAFREAQRGSALDRELAKLA